jgi:hypothetical protein
MPVLSYVYQLFSTDQCQLHSYPPVERATASMSPLSEPYRWPLGHVPLPFPNGLGTLARAV